MRREVLGRKVLYFRGFMLWKKRFTAYSSDRREIGNSRDSMKEQLYSIHCQFTFANCKLMIFQVKGNEKKTERNFISKWAQLVNGAESRIDLSISCGIVFIQISYFLWPKTERKWRSDALFISKIIKNMKENYENLKKIRENLKENDEHS